MARNVKFKVGDRVRIRQWDDMVREFGVGSGGHIPCASMFSVDMKYLCGSLSTITCLDGFKGVRLHFDRGDVLWSFSTDMIEHNIQYDITPTALYQVGSTISGILIIPDMLEEIKKWSSYEEVNDDLVKIGNYYIPKDCITIKKSN